MKGYGYYHKRKNIKLRLFFIMALAGVLGYVLVKNVKLSSFFQSRDTDYKWIREMLKSFDNEKERMEKRVILNKISKRISKVFSDGEDLHDGEALYLLGSVSLRRALLEYNKELRNMYLDKAVSSFRKALAFVRESADLAVLHFELGKSYFYKGDYYYYESLLELETALKLGCSREAAEPLLSFLKNRAGDTSAVSELINNFRDSKEGSVENRFYDAYTFKNNRDYQKAEEYFTWIAGYFLKNPVRTEEDKYIHSRSFYTLGWLFFNRGDYRGALDHYRKALVYDSRDTGAYYWMGKTYEAMKNHRDARKMWEKVLEIDPHNQQALNKLKKNKAR